MLAGALLTAAAPAQGGEVKVAFSNGLVTIVATDASPRQIMAEWAKLGQVRITNLERLAGGPVTLQLKDVPEAQALETLLRGSAGYVAAPRAAANQPADVSRYDRILLMPGTAPALPPPGSATPAAQTNVSRGRVATAAPTFDPTGDDIADEPRMPAPQGAMPRPGAVTPGQMTMPGTGAMPGAFVMPGQTLAPGQSVSPGQLPSSIYSEQQPTQQAIPGGSSRQFTGYPVPQGPGGTGTATPGMPTAPFQIPTSPYPANGPAGLNPAQESMVTPGATTGVPGQSPASAARPGDPTAPTPSMFRNPYGLPEPTRAPVVDPYANPYGLPSATKPAAEGAAPGGAAAPGAKTPGAVTPGATTTPIKKSPGGGA